MPHPEHIASCVTNYRQNSMEQLEVTAGSNIRWECENLTVAPKVIRISLQIKFISLENVQTFSYLL